MKRLAIELIQNLFNFSAKHPLLSEKYRYSIQSIELERCENGYINDFIVDRLVEYKEIINNDKSSDYYNFVKPLQIMIDEELLFFINS